MDNLDNPVHKLENQFHRWLTEVLPLMKHANGECRLEAFAIEVLFSIAMELREIKEAITTARNVEAGRPAKPVRRGSKPQVRS